jgi:sigma-B regulation protein RsbU (phosphoserine phosphatase)
MTQIQAQSENPGLTPTKDIATQLRVLVVDDSKLQRRIVSLSLKKWGFQVTKAAGGEEALEICKTQAIDLVISDWMMPGMDGLEFCREFRKLNRERYGYFIVLTSKNEKMMWLKGSILVRMIFCLNPSTPRN